MQDKEIMNLILPFKDKLYRFAYRIVGNSFEAEDIVQEILIKVWKKKEQFSQIENKEAWCMTMTRNLAIDKKRAKKMKTSSIENFHHIKDQSDTPAISMERKETVNRVREMINSLPEKQASVIHLRDIEGLSYKEIGVAMGLSLDQVKVVLHRARKALKLKFINKKQ